MTEAFVMDVNDAKKLVCESGRKMLEMGLVAATWGNISCRVGDGTMVITPSGVPYEKMTPDDIVTVNIEDDSYTEGKPSSEFRMHSMIYRAREEANGIIHFHALYASTASTLKETIPPYFDDAAQLIGADLKTADYALAGTTDLGENVLKALEGRFGALMQNHGALCIGRDMDEAFAACVLTDKVCQAHLMLKNCENAVPVPPEIAGKMHDFYLNYYQSGR